jgi:hypothetical protein
LAFRLDRDTERSPLLDEEALRILIRAKLQDGRLPRNRPPRVYGGPGDGEICDACGTVVLMAQMLIESPDLQDGTVTKLHASCFQIWDSERLRLR